MLARSAEEVNVRSLANSCLPRKSRLISESRGHKHLPSSSKTWRSAGTNEPEYARSLFPAVSWRAKNEINGPTVSRRDATSRADDAIGNEPLATVSSKGYRSETYSHIREHGIADAHICKSISAGRIIRKLVSSAISASPIRLLRYTRELIRPYGWLTLLFSSRRSEAPASQTQSEDYTLLRAGTFGHNANLLLFTCGVDEESTPHLRKRARARCLSERGIGLVGRFHDREVDLSVHLARAIRVSWQRAQPT